MIPRASFEGSTRILKYELEEREDVTYTVCEYFATLIDQVDNYFMKALLSEQTFLKLHNKFMIGLTSINKEIDEERMRRRTLPEFSSKHHDVLQRQFGPSRPPDSASRPSTKARCQVAQMTLQRKPPSR